MTTITLDLTDQEITELRSAVTLRKQFARPGLNFSPITDEVIAVSAACTSLVDKVTEATDGIVVEAVLARSKP